MARVIYSFIEWIALICTVLCVSCDSTKTSSDSIAGESTSEASELASPKKSGSTSPAPTPTLDVLEIVAQQNHRVAGLRKFAARGSAELRWHDEKGDHFEQAQIDLAWRNGGEQISLRAEKLGERLAWAGANSTQWWLFEPKREPSRLWLGPRAMPMPDSLLPFAGPDALLELLAASPWPAKVAVTQQLDQTFTVEFARAPRGQWVRTRVEVQRNAGFPSHIWLVDAKGNVLAESELSEPVMANMNHLPMADRPMVASKITLKSMSNIGVWQIFWDEPGAREDRLKDRLFDVQVIRSVMLPAEVIDVSKDKPTP